MFVCLPGKITIWCKTRSMSNHLAVTLVPLPYKFAWVQGL